jgi:hypothetical protein
MCKAFQRFGGIRAFGNEFKVPLGVEEAGEARPEEHLWVEQHKPYALNGSSSIVHGVNLTLNECALPSPFAERSAAYPEDRSGNLHNLHVPKR